MWEMTVDMERSQIAVFAPASQRPSELPFNPYECNVMYEALRSSRHLLAVSYFNCTQACETALGNHVEYVYTCVSVSYVLV